MTFVKQALFTRVVACGKASTTRRAGGAAWEAMEAIHDSGRARMLGVSNVSLEQLQSLCQRARVRPRILQNRCYASQGWDRRVREFCAANEIVYQGFSLLTANRGVLAHAELARIAADHHRTIPQIIFRFAIEVGMVPLTGTRCRDHMLGDLDVTNFRLNPDQIARIGRLAEK